MRLAILGPLQVRGDDGPLKLPGRREATVLAMLALRANRAVSTEVLINAVWDDDPPQTALTQIQGCITQLRKLFSSAGRPEAVGRQAAGYLLTVATDELDALLFAELVRAADEADNPIQAGELLGQALALWQGPALAGVTSEVVRAGAHVLDEQRVAVQQRRLRGELDAGRHESALGELRLLVGEHPLHEPFNELLALGLYRSGRQSEALATLRQLRQQLVDQLGVDPGPDVEQLEQAILNHAERLLLPAADPDDGSSAGRPSVSASGSISAQSDTASPERPRQLPRVIADFIGRTEELARIAEVLRDGSDFAVPVVGIYGPGGVGKSTLALRAAHQAAQSFPDGQLYLDLDGVASEDRATQLLGRVLRALGVNPLGVPHDVHERTELYRSLVAGRRILLMLDGVSNEQQVVPLIPGSPTCAVILTSRSRLDLLDGAHWLELGDVDAHDSLRMLSAIIGPARVQAELEAARELTTYTSGLPLALRFVGSRLASRPNWRVAELTRRMANESRRLDELSFRGRELRAGMASGYRSLTTAAKQLFRQLSVVKASDFPSWVAASVTDTPLASAELNLETLVDVQLIQVRDPLGVGDALRYGFHDLVRVYAAELLAADGEQAAMPPVQRLLGSWLTLLDVARQVIHGGEFETITGNAPRYPAPDEAEEYVRADPLGWMESERITLVQAVRQAADLDLSETCWEIALKLNSLFEMKGYHDDWRDSANVGLQVCRRTGNRRGEAAMLYSLSGLETHLDVEGVHGAEALRIFRELGDEQGIAQELRNQAYMARTRADVTQMRRLAEQAASLLHALGDPVGEAGMMSLLVWAELHGGDLNVAEQIAQRAHSLVLPTGDTRTIAQVEFRRAQIDLARQRFDAAVARADAVLQVTRELGDLVGQAYATRLVGGAQLGAGDREAARRTLLEAEQMAKRIGMHGLVRQIEETLTDLGREP